MKIQKNAVREREASYALKMLQCIIPDPALRSRPFNGGDLRGIRLGLRAQCRGARAAGFLPTLGTGDEELQNLL